jgi:hypothetical protein
LTELDTFCSHKAPTKLLISIKNRYSIVLAAILLLKTKGDFMSYLFSHSTRILLTGLCITSSLCLQAHNSSNTDEAPPTIQFNNDNALQDAISSHRNRRAQTVANELTYRAVNNIGCSDFSTYFKEDLLPRLASLKERQPAFNQNYMRNLIWDYSRRRYKSHNRQYSVSSDSLITLMNSYLRTGTLDENQLANINKLGAQNGIPCTQTRPQTPVAQIPRAIPVDEETLEPIVVVPEPHVADNKDKPAEDNASLSDGLMSADLRKVLFDSIKDSSPLLRRAPEGIQKVCPRFNSLSNNDKRNVWVHFMEATAQAESRMRPAHTFNEPFNNSKGERVISTGMLQLSYESARGHYNACRNQKRASCGCRGATTEKLKDPKFNLECGITIMESQANAWQTYKRGGSLHRTVRPKFANYPASEGLFTHYYWSVLNPEHDPSGYKRFQDHLKKLRMPAACGR